jgi:fructuronate reductase
MSPERLSLDHLAALPALIARPDYDIGAVTTGIVHLGLGAFHRAHQAVYTDAILHRHLHWGICGVSLKTPRVIAALAPQDGLYTVLEKSGKGTSARVIGSVREMLFLGTERDRVLARIADPAVRVVSLTVTEKGYCHDPATGRLSVLHPDIAHDLAHPEAPVSAIGVLAAGLAARREAAGGPINVICCDNLPHNGRTVEGIVTAYAQASDPALADWIGTHVAFPCTMVDRIVPATTEADIAETSRLLGVVDAAPVVTEPYNSWVIEDRFAAARPPWEDAGARIVADVAPFETMKLRLLNGSHSTLAYLGFLSGHEFIWQASADPLLATLVERLMAEEVMPTLVAPPGVDLRAYGAQLILRFRNPALPHRTQQIAMDGSQKLPQRLLATVRERLAGGGSIAHLALAIAGWIRYASGTDEHGKPIVVSDPLSAKFAAVAAAARGNAAYVADGFLDLAEVFGADLSANAVFRRAVSRDVGGLLRDGVRRTLAVHIAQRGA